MRLACVGNVGSDLPPDALKRSGNTPESRFNVTIGREYTVHAMVQWPWSLGVLIVDDTGKPNWKSIWLFQVVDGRLPEGWEFAPVADHPHVLALWGYPSLIRDPDHHDDLINRKVSALEVFLRDTGTERTSAMPPPSRS